jgi:hypothetical protein
VLVRGTVRAVADTSLVTHSAFRFVGEPADAIVRTGPDANVLHFEGQALHLTCRIRDHVERLDGGVVYAVDDLAVTLRAMLHGGKGNGVLSRLRRICGRADIEVRLSRPPAFDGAQFSVGSIPTSASSAGEHGATWVRLEEWASRPLLSIVIKGKPVTYTWGEFLNTYANKWGGAHLDRTVPEHLQIIDLYDAGGLALSGYLLRSASVQVWLIAQAIFSDARFVRSGSPLTREELAGTRLTALGGIADDPQDRRGLGELQWLDNSPEGVDFLWYVERERPARLTLQAGNVSWNITYNPPETGTSDASEHGDVQGVQRARDPILPDLKAADFSQKRTIAVNGRVLMFDEVDPSRDVANSAQGA